MAATTALGIHFIVAVDGSELGHQAFLTAAKMVQPKDRIEVLHAFDSQKDFLPYDMTPEGIRNTYEAELVGRFPSDRRELVLVKKPKDRATREAICQHINSHPARERGLLVVGMVGRKGPKEDPSILGSTADFSMRSAHMSSMIIKRKAPSDTKNIIVVGVDGSDMAAEAVNFCLGLKKAGDEFILVHVGDSSMDDKLPEGGKSSAVQERYTRWCADQEGARFELISKGSFPTIADRVVDFCADVGATLMCCGIDGMTAHTRGHHAVGSTSDRIVKVCRSNVLVFHPSDDDV